MKQPRIAIYYHTNFSRNDGPPLYYFNAMRSLGLDVTHLMPEGDTSKYGKFDYHFLVDYGEDGLPVDHSWRIPKDGGRTIYVASDTHLDNGYRFEKADNFSNVFFNQKRALSEYKKRVRPDLPEGSELLMAHWLPHAAEPQAYPHTVQAKKYDVCFIGHLSDEPNTHGLSRVETLDRAFRAFPNFYFGTRNPQKPGVNMFDDAAKKFNQSRIVLNHAVRDDLNMRFFEVLCAGSFLLTTRLPDSREIGLVEGEHFAAYASYDELLEKITYYLAHPEEMEVIAKAGHAAFMEKHTYQHRVRTVLKIVAPNTYKSLVPPLG